MAADARLGTQTTPELQRCDSSQKLVWTPLPSMHTNSASRGYGASPPSIAGGLPTPLYPKHVLFQFALSDGENTGNSHASQIQLRLRDLLLYSNRILVSGSPYP